MRKKGFFLALLIALVCSWLIPSGCPAETSGLRLLYIGSLSGYVKLCG
ncbi:MAG: hypothetical protein JXR89_05590 [Deltaproteobacteria bacterium]|nr:hypothetical protein [Deltaproteobacteria bacterium]